LAAKRPLAEHTGALKASKGSLRQQFIDGRTGRCGSDATVSVLPAEFVEQEPEPELGAAQGLLASVARMQHTCGRALVAIASVRYAGASENRA